MLHCAESVYFIRVDARLPDKRRLFSSKHCKGWDSVPFSDARVSGKRGNGCGGQLVAQAEPLLTGGLGSTPQDATARALELALPQVSKSFNAARVEYLRVTQYPWFYLATVAVYPHTIELGAVVPMPVKPVLASHRRLIRQVSSDMIQ